MVSTGPTGCALPRPVFDEEEGVLLEQQRTEAGADDDRALSPERGAEDQLHPRSKTSSTRSFVGSIRTSIFRKNGPEHDWFIVGGRQRRRLCCTKTNESSSPNDDADLEGYQALVSNQSVFARSINAIRFAVFADTVNGMVLYPNYALMALPGNHEESFPSTYPFGFSSATYFIPLSGLLGMAVSCIFMGKLSDRIGRKPVVIICMAGSMFGSALKWFLRGSFWGFCAANFVNGLLSGSLPVALAYVSDIFTSERKKAKNFSVIVALYVLGQSTGGILGILLQEHGLFAPLWAGVAIMFLGLTINLRYLIEPGRIQIPEELGGDDEDEDDRSDLPTSINKSLLIHILIGAFVDIAGSKTLFPLCMSPFAFETFYLNFVDAKQEPIMSVVAYKWLTVLVSLLVLPSAIVAPKVFQRFGLAVSCVFGNAFTGVVTIALLYIGNVNPPTDATFAGFVTVLYVGFPFTVVSQLAISPMLDKISPLDRRGFIQGSFTTILNLGNAIAPWILGIAADVLGTSRALWIGIGLSVAATLINSPLLLKKVYKRLPQKKTETPLEDFTLSPEEEEEYIQKALKGEYVPAQVIQFINIRRIRRGEKYILNHAGSYESDKERLGQICSEAKDEFKILRRRLHHTLARVNKDPSQLFELVETINHAYPKEMEDIHKEMGLWFGDYLKDNGYIGLTPVQNIKLMIMRAFPAVNRDGELNAKNFEETLLNMTRVYNRYLQDELEADAEHQAGLRNLFKRPPRRLAPVG